MWAGNRSMNITSRLRKILSPLAQKLAGVLSDRRGVAAVEFAFIVPVLLCMYFITMEASQGIGVNKKVSRIGSAVADLITQQSQIQASEVIAIMKIGKSIIQPYNRSDPTIEVTAIQFDTNSTPVARVAWSLKLKPDGSATQVATRNDIVSDSQLAKIRASGAFYIRVTSKLDYDPVITWSEDTEPIGLLASFSNIHMGETFYLRPRISTTIPCPDCP